MSEKENNKKEYKNSEEKKSPKIKAKTQEYISPPRIDASKDKVTKGLTNDESTLGGSDTGQLIFPDS